MPVTLQYEKLTLILDPADPLSGVPNVEGASRIMETVRKLELNRDRTIRNTIRTIAQSTKRRIRSLSPKKHRRKMLPGEWTQENDLTAGMGNLGLGAAGPSS